jgi:aquaporin Z
MAAKYLAEFIGTFFLTLVVGCNTLSNSYIWGATSCACTLMVLIYAFGPVSGGHFNPAVTVACFICNRIGFGEFLIYLLSQTLGALLGAATYAFLFMQSFNIAPMPGFSWDQAAAVEIIYTMMLCFVVLSCAVAQSKDFAPLAIGFVLVAGAHGGGAISGGCFNPAIALAVDVASAGLGFGWSIAYAGFEFVGAALASVLYRITRPREYGLEDPTIATFKGDAVNLSMIVSELLGTLILTVTVGFNVLANSKAGAWSIGAALMSMVYSLGDVSGAHFNPAVTLATLAAQALSPVKAVTYWVAQFVGGIFGAWLFAITYGWETFSLGPSHDHYWLTRNVIEVFFTFTLCLTVLSVACVKATRAIDEYFGLAIGLAITVGGYVLSNVSGGTMNPAVTFGVYTTGWLTRTSMGIFGTVMYIIDEFLGGLFAAVVFNHLRPEEYGRKHSVWSPKSGTMGMGMPSGISSLYPRTVGAPQTEGSPMQLDVTRPASQPFPSQPMHPTTPAYDKAPTNAPFPTTAYGSGQLPPGQVPQNYGPPMPTVPQMHGYSPPTSHVPQTFGSGPLPASVPGAIPSSIYGVPNSFGAVNTRY